MPDESGGNNSQSKKGTGFFDKFFKNKNHEEMQQEAEDEILSLVEEGNEKGVIKSSTKDIIENIFDFDDLSVGEIMTHRTDMVAISDDASLSDVVNTAISTGYSRIPVYHEDMDKITGVLYVKDLLRYVLGDVPKDFKLSNVTREVLYVPKTKKCSLLFAEMTKKKMQFAIVVDEYGGTDGLITLEDLIEEILGNIQDEFDHEKEEIKELSANKFTADGSLPLDEVEDLTGTSLKNIETDSETIAGLILDKIGRIPKEGEHPSIIVNNLMITVDKIEDRRISSVIIEKRD